MTDHAEETPPVLRIVNPDATAEEVAALVAVFSSLGSDEPPAPKPVSQWAAPYRGLRGPMAPGWRASGLPR